MVTNQWSVTYVTYGNRYYYVRVLVSWLGSDELSMPDGSHIPIEERNMKEVTHVGGAQMTPNGARIRNPAFDVTPHKYITAIITERGVYKPPFIESLASAFDPTVPEPATA